MLMCRARSCIESMYDILCQMSMWTKVIKTLNLDPQHLGSWFYLKQRVRVRGAVQPSTSSAVADMVKAASPPCFNKVQEGTPTTPDCPSCDLPMMFSNDYTHAEYVEGYVCSECDYECENTTESRWWCSDCGEDYCINCHAGPVRPSVRQALLGSGPPPGSDDAGTYHNTSPGPRCVSFETFWQNVGLRLLTARASVHATCGGAVRNRWVTYQIHCQI